MRDLHSKRIIWFLIIIVLIGCLFGCGQNGTEQSISRTAEPFTPVAVQAKKDYQKLVFDDFYSDKESKTLSPKISGMSGQLVQIDGFMAPPLTPELEFFVLTRYMMEQCPFCAALAQWPADIVLVYMPEGQSMEVTDHPLIVKGRLEVGEETDEQTGFVSLVRIYVEKIEVLE
ncbi:hypothetical protein EHS13_07010 [Paenibacillus psychroresistens]|uniref:DUF3299 domain-containing protein n=1 Tax=Paenibacillus psychroresistens TaxID=1778678 RepID=A0A6B8RFZ9_9BACL|nr:hypothetical protein [Paenibacillus psychroresistens]QGQ94654.1 hypothetical protein EHS13_07010 [Paenibacillus psychroresistens]